MKTTTIIVILSMFSTFFILMTLWLDYENKKLKKQLNHYQTMEEKQNESTNKDI